MFRLKRVEANLSEIGFQCVGSSTIVADGKFWKKMLYVNKEETISVSEEIGDAYPKGSHNHYMWIQIYYLKHHRRSEKLMPLYECNEQQFVENIRRMIESSERFLVNRKINLHDDARYGPALPDSEFESTASFLGSR